MRINSSKFFIRWLQVQLLLVLVLLLVLLRSRFQAQGPERLQPLLLQFVSQRLFWTSGAFWLGTGFCWPLVLRGLRLFRWVGHREPATRRTLSDQTLKSSVFGLVRIDRATPCIGHRAYCALH